jgi:low affinity Fe/Cu permease
VQLKLSELVLAMKGAKNKYASIEDLSDAELHELHNDCRMRAEMTGEHLERRRVSRPANGNGKHKPTAASRAKIQRRPARYAAKP